MKRKKFDFRGAERKKELLLGLTELCEIVNPKTKVTACKADPDDNKFPEAAIDGNERV